MGVTFWEVRVSHPDPLLKVEAVGVPVGATVDQVKATAQNEFGDNALAVRHWNNEPWRDL